MRSISPSTIRYSKRVLDLDARQRAGVEAEHGARRQEQDQCDEEEAHRVATFWLLSGFRRRGGRAGPTAPALRMLTGLRLRPPHLGEVVVADEQRLEAVGPQQLVDFLAAHLATTVARILAAADDEDASLRIRSRAARWNCSARYR